MKNKLAMVSLALVAFGTSSVAHTQPADAATLLGGVDLSRYCRSIYGSTASAVLIAGNAYSWRCFRGGVYYSIDVNAACRSQYGNPAYASTSNSNDPYSWRCYR